MILIGVLTGCVSGLAAVGLNRGLRFFHHHLDHSQDYFWSPALPLFGLLLTVLFLKYVVKDYGGHGVPEVIQSISMKGGTMKFRSSYSRIVGSLFTISSGGSAGPEAPIVITGAAIGSNVARYFRCNENIKVAVTGSGAAAAIGAIFNAPVTGVIFTVEVILGEWSQRTMLPVVIASVTGTEISRILNGNQISFAHRLFNVGVNDMLACLGFCIILSLFAFLFIKALRGSRHFLERYFHHPVARVLAGGVLVSVIIYFFPQTRGEGYDLVRELISGSYKESIFMLAVAVFFKMLATALTLSCGGAGGVFAPSLVLGSLSGYLYFKILHFFFPGAAFSPSSLFALVGMAGMISGAMQAPLSGIFLIIEITGGYHAILPLLMVSFITATLVKFLAKYSIYHHELIQKGHLRRPRTDARILGDIRPEELMETNLETVSPDFLLKDLIPVMERTGQECFPVADKDSGNFLGMVYLSEIKPYLFNADMLNSTIVGMVIRTYPELAILSLDDPVARIMDTFDACRLNTLPVVSDRRFIGVIAKITILDHYRKELKTQTHID